MMINTPIISTKKMSKSYGNKQNKHEVLKNISLEIRKGETVAIVGKSGSGKSTLLHVLATLDQPTSGEVLLHGEVPQKKNLEQIRNQTFGFVFQHFFMNPNQTVLENVLLPLKIAKVPSKKRKIMAIDILRKVGLEDKAKNKAADLSGGQKQRVCIARALINQPEIIFADEPTGNLDSKTAHEIEDLLFYTNQEFCSTLVIVTHDEDLAGKCDRQLLLGDGQLMEVK